MKNIHVLPIDKPSRIAITDTNVLGMYKVEQIAKYGTNQNIYITNDEEIKEGDWYLYCGQVNKRIRKNPNAEYPYPNYKKIILTTDIDLIKNGVQAIDDTFLEWFVKNPSCERVEVEKDYSYGNLEHFDYKIIIPKEEPKQHVKLINENIHELDKKMKEFKHKVEIIPAEEVLANRSNAYEFIDFDKQETVEEYFLSNIKNMLQFNNDALAIRFMEKYYNAKSQQDKNLYSKEDMKEAFQVGFNVGYNDEISPSYLKFEEWFKQFKNK